MRAVVDTNQALKLTSRSTGGDPSRALSEIALAPYVLAEILLRGNPEPTLTRLRAFTVRYGLEPVKALETVATLTETEIMAFEPFAVPGSATYEAFRTALYDPSPQHVEWAHRVKADNLSFCGLMFERAQCFRRKLRERKIQNPRFEDMAEALLQAGTSATSFLGSLVLSSISNDFCRKLAVREPDLLYGAVIRKQYLGRFFKTIFYFVLSFSRLWKDQVHNFDPSAGRDDWTDITLPLYAGDGDVILTADTKLRNAIKVIEPTRAISGTSVDEL